MSDPREREDIGVTKKEIERCKNIFSVRLNNDHQVDDHARSDRLSQQHLDFNWSFTVRLRHKKRKENPLVNLNILTGHVEVRPQLNQGN